MLSPVSDTRPVPDAGNTETNKLRPSRLVSDPASSRTPSFLCLLLYWSPGQALPKALSLLVFSHHTNGNGQFTCLFLTVDSAALAHNSCDSGIPSRHTGPGREEASGLVQLMNGWLNERTKTKTEPTGPPPAHL